MILNSKTEYGFVSKNFHWIMAFLLITNYITGSFFDQLKDISKSFITLHFSLGILVFLLAFPRLLWRLFNTKPEKLTNNKITNKISNIVFTIFYFLMFSIPLTGYFLVNTRGKTVNFFGIKTLNIFSANPSLKGFAKGMHEVSANILLITLALHVIAALYNHFILKNSTLKRIV